MSLSVNVIIGGKELESTMTSEWVKAWHKTVSLEVKLSTVISVCKLFLLYSITGGKLVGFVTVYSWQGHQMYT